MSYVAKNKMTTNLYYKLVMIPCNIDIMEVSEVTSFVDYKRLDREVQREVMKLPVVKFTGNFKDGGLSSKQQFYLMTALSNVYFIDTTGTSYAKSITRIDNIPDISDITIQDRFQSSKNISLLKRSESFSITYDEIDYVIEIIEEGDGTFTSVEYDGNYLMDVRLEKEILDYFNKYK